MTHEIIIERTSAKNQSNYVYNSVALVCVLYTTSLTEVFVVVMNSIQFRVKDIIYGHLVPFAGVLHENRGKAVVHAHLKNDCELEKLLEELRDKLGPDNEAEPEPDQSMAVVSYSTQYLVIQIV
jgi:hypothetical protein